MANVLNLNYRYYYCLSIKLLVFFPFISKVKVLATSDLDEIYLLLTMLRPGIDQRRFHTDQLPSTFRIAFDFAVNLEDNNNCLQ